MDKSWDFDCPQYVDFTAPVQADDLEDVTNYFAKKREELPDYHLGEATNDQVHPITDIKFEVEQDYHESVVQQEQPKRGVPKNLCPSLSAWRKSKTNPTKAEPKPKSDVKRQSDDPFIHPASNPRSRIAAQAENRTTRSMKRSHSFSTVKPQDEPEGSSPARKSIKRSNSVKSIPGSKPLERHGSTGDLSSRRELKRSSSNSTLAASNGTGPSRLARTGSTGSLRSSSRPRILSSTKRTRSPSVDGQYSEDETNTSTHSNPCASKMAHSPSFVSRLRKKFAINPTKPKTSEELEIEQTEQMRKALRDQLKRNKHSCKKALAVKALPPSSVHSQPKTAIQEFHFQTDTRIKTHKVESGGGETKDFVHSLRSRSPPKQRKIPSSGVTMVEPFNLTERRLKTEENPDSAKFKTMAETVLDFHRRTPDRFRTKVKGAATCTTTGPQTRLKNTLSATIPKSPLFQTKSRSRPFTAPSKEQLEEQELEEIRQKQVKAHPVNHKIFTHPGIGLKKVESKPATQVEEFRLTSGNKVKANNSLNKEETQSGFKARPVPAKILKGVVGLKPALRVSPTVPQSPALSVKLRARLPRVHIDQEEEVAPVLHRAVPHTGIPFQPQLAHKHVTVEPFHFDERDKERRAKKEEKLKHIYEEENKVRDFQANPLPESAVSGNVVLPPKHCKPATIPQPFDLELDKRGKKRQEDFKHKIEEEKQHEKDLAVFKAQENATIYKKPFVPQKTGRQLADITEFELNTEKRAHERAALEELRKERMAELDACERQREIRKLEEEKEAVAQMRHDMVHRANPIRLYKPVEKPSVCKPVTMPMSPVFSTDRRLRSHKQDLSL